MARYPLFMPLLLLHLCCHYTSLFVTLATVVVATPVLIAFDVVVAGAAVGIICRVYRPLGKPINQKDGWAVATAFSVYAQTRAYMAFYLTEQLFLKLCNRE